MKRLPLLACVTALAVGCGVTEPSSEEVLTQDEQSDLLSAENTPSPLAAGCWAFVFGANGSFFPNPIHFGRVPEILKTLKINLNLLALDTDGVQRSATLNTEVTNSSGQQVASFSLGSFPSANSFEAGVWSGGITGVAAGLYVVKVTAVSDICGQKSIQGSIIAN